MENQNVVINYTKIVPSPISPRGLLESRKDFVHEICLLGQQILEQDKYAALNIFKEVYDSQCTYNNAVEKTKELKGLYFYALGTHNANTELYETALDQFAVAIRVLTNDNKVYKKSVEERDDIIARTATIDFLLHATCRHL